MIRQDRAVEWPHLSKGEALSVEPAGKMSVDRMGDKILDGVDFLTG